VALVLAFGISSFIFSAVHHIPPYGDPLHLDVFTFRFLAGICFGLLFWFRGFAVAAYTHALYDIYVLVQLIRLIRRERFAIVHTHSAKGGFLGRLAAWLCRTPVVVHTFHGFSVHDFMSRRKRRGYLLLERAVRRPTHAFFAVSPRVAREAVELRLAADLDVFVISSLYEGLGRALTEALGTGRPVVATAVNGVPDLVTPGATGLLAPPAAPEALAECVCWMLDHPAEARRMGEQGRARVLATFEPAVMCRLLDRGYARLLGLPEPDDHLIALPIDGTNGHRRDADEQVVLDLAD